MEEKKYIKIYNPTKQLVKINYKGRNESLEPSESKVLDSAIAMHWFRIHGFLEIALVDKPSVEKEIPIEVVKETIEVVKEVKPEVKEIKKVTNKKK